MGSSLSSLILSNKIHGTNTAATKGQRVLRASDQRSQGYLMGKLPELSQELAEEAKYGRECWGGEKRQSPVLSLILANQQGHMPALLLTVCLLRMVWTTRKRSQGPSWLACADLIHDRDTNQMLSVPLAMWLSVYTHRMPPSTKSLVFFASLPQDFSLFLFWIGSRYLFNSPAVTAKKCRKKCSQGQPASS